MAPRSFHRPESPEVEYRAKITDRKTGASATTVERWSRFWWLEGNGSCDCNRQCALERALGRDFDPMDASCFHCEFPDGRFALELVE